MVGLTPKSYSWLIEGVLESRGQKTSSSTDPSSFRRLNKVPLSLAVRSFDVFDYEYIKLLPSLFFVFKWLLVW